MIQRRLTLVLSLLALGFVPACKKPAYPACKKDKHCKAEAGEKCVDGSCQNCKEDTECAGKGPDGTDFQCINFRCQDPAAAGADQTTETPGGPCAQTLDCEGGLVCRAGSCDLCTDDIECDGNACNFATGRCDPTGQCTTDDQCPMDEICDGGMCVFSGYSDEPGAGPCGVEAVYFAFDSDKLTPKAEESLNALATCIAEQGTNVILEAHADSAGTEEYNIQLTERRGQSVKGFLVGAGAPAELLQVIAKGSLQAMGTTESERAKDRRVQFFFE